MKDRIRDTINSTPGLEEETNLIDGAYITTFDSFSLSMVKKYHDRLNVTNKIKISDEVVIDIKKHELLDEIFDEYYEKPSEEFKKLISDFCLKDDKELKELAEIEMLEAKEKLPHIEEELKKLPGKPGVYVMHDKDDIILYVESKRIQ